MIRYRVHISIILMLSPCGVIQASYPYGRASRLVPASTALSFQHQSMLVPIKPHVSWMY